jgi:hypothetical protein
LENQFLSYKKIKNKSSKNRNVQVLQGRRKGRIVKKLKYEALQDAKAQGANGRPQGDQQGNTDACSAKAAGAEGACVRV